MSSGTGQRLQAFERNRGTGFNRIWWWVITGSTQKGRDLCHSSCLHSWISLTSFLLWMSTWPLLCKLPHCQCGLESVDFVCFDWLGSSMLPGNAWVFPRQFLYASLMCSNMSILLKISTYLSSLSSPFSSWTCLLFCQKTVEIDQLSWYSLPMLHLHANLSSQFWRI
jgi:hypothetical protein